MFGNSTDRQHERDQTISPIYVFTYTYMTSLFKKYFKTLSKKKKFAELDEKIQFPFKQNTKYNSERRSTV